MLGIIIIFGECGCDELPAAVVVVGSVVSNTPTAVGTGSAGDGERRARAAEVGGCESIWRGEAGAVTIMSSSASFTAILPASLRDCSRADGG